MLTESKTKPLEASQSLWSVAQMKCIDDHARKEPNIPWVDSVSKKQDQGKLIIAVLPLTQITSVKVPKSQDAWQASI